MHQTLFGQIQVSILATRSLELELDGAFQVILGTQRTTWTPGADAKDCHSIPTDTLELYLTLLPGPLSRYPALHLYSCPLTSSQFQSLALPVSAIPSFTVENKPMLHYGNITKAHNLVALSQDLVSIEVSRKGEGTNTVTLISRTQKGPALVVRG